MAKMNVEWEKTTFHEFEEHKKSGVCVLPLGCLEMHGPHLPMGTDILMAHHIAVQAAEREPVLVGPRIPFGLAQPSMALPGALGIPASMLLELWIKLCEEISRNGFKKILIFGLHGGNGCILETMMSEMHARRRDYTLYLIRGVLPLDELLPYAKGVPVGHACKVETSWVLSALPELVQMDRLPDRQYDSSGDIGLGEVATPARWWNSWPENYVGDSRLADAEDGAEIVEKAVQRLAKAIRAVKDDTRGAEVLQDFFDAMEKGGSVPDFE